jgi:hypothetical protein
MMRMYKRGILVFGVVSMALGVAIVARSSNWVGALVGVLFIAVGAGRIYLLVRR